METLGNNNLFKLHRIGFLAGRKIMSLSVLPTLDWAVSVAKRKDVAVVSGFHSKIEREVLEYLLKGKCGIICVLARAIYRQVPSKYMDAYKAGRVLFLSPFEKAPIRAGREFCQKRNEYVASISKELILSSLSPESSLSSISHPNKVIL